jgi:hypothetical protein
MRWILKKFWFPILLIVLKLLSKKYPIAGKAYRTITKFSDPLEAFSKPSGSKTAATKSANTKPKA